MKIDCLWLTSCSACNITAYFFFAFFCSRFCFYYNFCFTSDIFFFILLFSFVHSFAFWLMFKRSYIRTYLQYVYKYYVCMYVMSCFCVCIHSYRSLIIYHSFRFSRWNKKYSQDIMVSIETISCSDECCILSSFAEWNRKFENNYGYTVWWERLDDLHHLQM